MGRQSYSSPLAVLLMLSPLGCVAPLGTLQVISTNDVQQVARHGVYYGVSSRNGVTCALSARLNEFTSDDNAIYMNIRIQNDSANSILVRPTDLELFYRQNGRWHATTLYSPRQLKADLVNRYKQTRQSAARTRSKTESRGYIEPPSTLHKTHIKSSRKHKSGEDQSASRHVSSEKTIESEGLRGFERVVSKAQEALDSGKMGILDDHTLQPGESIDGMMVADGRVQQPLDDAIISSLFGPDSDDMEDRKTNGDFRILFKIGDELHEFRVRMKNERDGKPIW